MCYTTGTSTGTTRIPLRQRYHPTLSTGSRIGMFHSNQHELIIKLLYVLMLSLTIDHLVNVESLAVTRTAFHEQSIASLYPLVQNQYYSYGKKNQILVRHNSHERKQNIDISPRRDVSFVALHLFRRTSQMGMVVKGKDDTTSTMNNNDQETKSMETRDDGLFDENLAANHYFDSAIINHKLQGLNLSDQKLLVLQDAAKRMAQRHEAQLKEVQQHHSKNIETSIEESNTQHQKEIERLTRTMERRLQQMEIERNKVSDELKRTKQEFTKLLETERNANIAKLDEIHQKYQADRAYWFDTERQLRDELESVENASATVQSLDLDLRQQNEKYQLLKEKYETYRARYHHATAEIEQLRDGKTKLEAELEFERENITKLQQQFKEQMEIAESSVTVATSREHSLQVQYDALQQTNNNLRDDVSRLNQELQQQQDLYEELNSKFLDESTKSHSPLLSNALQRFRKYIWANDRSLVRTSCHWIQRVFVPKIFPFRFVSKRHLSKPSENSE